MQFVIDEDEDDEDDEYEPSISITSTISSTVQEESSRPHKNNNTNKKDKEQEQERLETEESDELKSDVQHSNLPSLSSNSTGNENSSGRGGSRTSIRSQTLGEVDIGEVDTAAYFNL